MDLPQPFQVGHPNTFAKEDLMSELLEKLLLGLAAPALLAAPKKKVAKKAAPKKKPAKKAAPKKKVARKKAPKKETEEPMVPPPPPPPPSPAAPPPSSTMWGS
jgi:hypothetical protein